MSFASGLVAGQRAAQGAIDAFRQARTNRNLRRANEEIDQLEQGLIQNDIEASQGFVGPMPTEAAETQRAQGLGIPQTPASQQAMLRANIYRKHGLMDDYEKSFQRGVTLSELERQSRQDAEDRRQFDVTEARRKQLADSITGLQGAQAAGQDLENTLRQFDIDNVEGFNKLNQSFTEWQAANPKADVSDYMETTEWKSADPRYREALASQYYDTNKAENAVGVQIMKGKLDKETTVDGMLGVYSQDTMLTPEFDYGKDPVEGKDGTFNVYAKRGDQKEIVFTGTDSEIKSWLYSRVESGEAGAAYASKLKATAGEIAREIYELETDRGKLNAEMLDERQKNIISLISTLEEAANLNSDHPMWKLYKQMGADETDPLKGMAAKANLALFMVSGGIPIPGEPTQGGEGTQTPPAATTDQTGGLDTTVAPDSAAATPYGNYVPGLIKDTEELASGLYDPIKRFGSNTGY